MTYQWPNTIREGFVLPQVAGLPLWQAAANVAAGLESHLLASASVRAFVEALPKGHGTTCPDSSTEEIVKYLANRKGVVNKGDPELNLRFVQDRVLATAELERESMAIVIRNASDSLISERMFGHCVALAGAVDRFFIEWYGRLVTPYQSLSPEEQNRYKNQLRTILPKYDYTVFELDPEQGCVNRRTWAEAFPEEIGEICGCIYDIINAGEFGVETDKYFRALRKAYACTDIPLLEEAWATVDHRWVEIPKTADIMPMHGMESGGYMHPFCVIPEFRLHVRTPHHRELINSVIQSMIAQVEALDIPAELKALAIEKLRTRADVAEWARLIAAGGDHLFRFGGQSVPNRQEVSIFGVRVLLDNSAPLRRAEQYKNLLRKHCPPNVADVLVPLVTARAIRTFIIGHELAHIVGRTARTDETLNDALEYCEEMKATILSLLTICSQGDPPSLTRMEVLAFVIPRIIHTAMKDNRTDQSFQPYVRESLAMATILLKIGVIVVTDKGVVLDSERRSFRNLLVHSCKN